MSLERKIQHRLGKWREAGLITPEQAEAIRQYEHQHSGSALMFWLMWLAGSSIVLGIIAMIAANWELIPAGMKLVLYFVGFGAAAFALVKTFAGKPIVQEVMRLALMAYTMAGIGLVAQIYHLHSAPYRGIVFWCVLTLGLALLCKTPLGAFAWIPMAFAALAMFLDAQHYSTAVNSYIYIGLITFLGVVGSRARRFPLLKHFQTASFILAASSAFLTSLVAAYSFYAKRWVSNEILASICLGLVLWALAIYTNKDLDRVTRNGFVLFLGFVLLQALTVAGFHDTQPSLGLKTLSVLEFSLGTIALAIAAFSFGKRGVFEALIIFVFLRLFTMYGEFMVSAMMGGFGFITFGLLIFGAIYIWKRVRTDLFKKLEENLDAKK